MLLLSLTGEIEEDFDDHQDIIDISARLHTINGKGQVTCQQGGSQIC